MNKIKLLGLTLFIIGFILTVSSCQKDPIPTDPSEDNFSSDEFELIIIDNTESDIGDCDESYEIIIIPAYGYSDDDCRDMGWELKKDRGNHYGQRKHEFKKEKRGYKLHLGFILRKLNNKFEFTSEQIDSIKLYIQDHIECVKTQMLLLRSSEHLIIDSANHVRDSLIVQAKNEGWTKEQLKDSLIELNKRTRIELRENPIRLEVCVAIKACRMELFNRIELILTPEQYLIWLEWREKLPEINCGDE